MILFEIVTDRVGESYVRAYAWAESKERAIELFESVPSPYVYTAVEIIELFNSEDAPFITEISDRGFGLRVTK
jgi:hypothetical protein